MSQDTTSWSLYPYDASKPLPIVFAAIVTILGCILFYQSVIRYRWFHFGYICTIATCVWVAGFVCRAITAYQPQNIPLFIAQYVMVLMGPPLFAASETFILGRILAYVPYHAPIHPGRVLTTFLLLSAVVESLTASGAANSAAVGRDEDKRKTGQDCIKAGLILQAFIELGFSALTAWVQYRMSKAKTQHKPRFVVLFPVLYVTSAMMFVRCIIRAVEGFEQSVCAPNDPYCGYISRHEWFLWVFEVANITVFVALLALFHPGRFLPSNYKIYLDPNDGQTERLGPGFGKADRRPLVWTVLDPFDIYGIATGQGRRVEPFWLEDHPVCDSGAAKAGKIEAAERAVS